MIESFSGKGELKLADKITHLSWGLVLLITAIAGVGMLLLYSAAGGDWEPWAARHGLRFIMSLVLMFAIALIDLRFWLRMAYPIYALTLLLLVAVEIMGFAGMGAQRWIDLGVIILQPSELMKIALVLALARYFHALAPEQSSKLTMLILPVFLIMMPVGLVLLQPNLGTAALLVAGSAMLFWGAGVTAWLFVAGVAAVAAIVPIGWHYLHDYQKQRVLTFLYPETDPQGTGYNIIQSKIAFGSGGIFGKGFLKGSQSQLAFLPEKHTDFIFVVLAEEFGLIGALFLLALYTAVIGWTLSIALSSRNQFGRLVALGIAGMVFLYVIVNIAMITGLIPVVGIPLPLVSNGGTAMLTMMIGMGLVLCVAVHKEVRL